MNLRASTIMRILGIVLMVIGLAMLPSFLVSLICGETRSAIVFAMLAAGYVVLGLVMTRVFKPNNVTLRIREGLMVVVFTWIMMTAFGCIPYIATGVMPNVIDAFFESCSGFSTTGVSVVENLDALPRGLIFWRSTTQWIGGIGILVFAISFMPSLGISAQNIAASETTGPVFDKSSSRVSDMTKNICIVYAALTLCEFLLLLPSGMGVYDAILTSFGTTSTGGFTAHAGSIAYFGSNYVKLVVTLFMFLAGVCFQIYVAIPKSGVQAIKESSELKFYFVLVVAVTAFVFAATAFRNPIPGDFDMLVDAGFETTSFISTTGFSSADYTSWSAPSQMILFTLLFIGACSGSAGGGIKIARILILLKLVKRVFTTKLHPTAVEDIKLSGKPVGSTTVSNVVSFTVLYMVLIFLGSLVVSIENLDMMSSFSTAASCLGNIGPAFGTMGPGTCFETFNGFTKLFLSAYMIAGRLEVYVIFTLLTPWFWGRRYM